MANIAPPPYQTELVEQQGEGALSGLFMVAVWVQWFLKSLLPRVQSAPTVLKSVTVSGQNTSIGTTALPTGVLASGQYRVSYYARVTAVGSVTSSLTVTIGWTESGIALTFSGSAITSNLTTSVQTGTAMITVDQASAVTYATTYASNAAGTMHYTLTVVLEQLT